MKFEKLLLATAGICGVVGVHGHEHGHHHDEKEIPLHEQEYIQDNPEELERKWGFEVTGFLLRFWGYILRCQPFPHQALI